MKFWCPSCMLSMFFINGQLKLNFDFIESSNLRGFAPITINLKNTADLQSDYIVNGCLIDRALPVKNICMRNIQLKIIPVLFPVCGILIIFHDPD
jgi:hypothetical protein